MQLEGMSGEEIVNTELSTGVPIVYRLDKDGGFLFPLAFWKSRISLFTVYLTLICRQSPFQGDPQPRLNSLHLLISCEW